MAVVVFHNRPQRKTPAPKGARVYRRMGEGLGAGGHSTRRYRFNAEASIRFPYPRNYFRTLPRAGRRRRRERARCAKSTGSSTWRPSGNSRYRKRMRRRPCPPPRPSTTYRVPTGNRLGRPSAREPMHILLKAKNHAWELSSSNVRTPRRFRDSLATGRDFCESLWTRSVSRTRAFRGQSREARIPERRGVFPTPDV